MSAYYFGTVSLVGILTNLLTLWAVSLAFYGIVAVCVMSLFWMKAAGFLAFLSALPMRYVLWMAKILSAFPLAALYTKSIYVVLWLVFVYILLGIFLASRKRHPMVLACCAVAGLCLALMLSWNEHRFSDTHFTALDVGQGQSLILHHDGKTFLIDCGGSNDETAANTAAETLLSRGITHLDGIILTHGDRDHAGGIPLLLTRIDSNFLMLPATTTPETLEQITGNWSGNVIWVEEDLFLQMGLSEMTVFGPTFVPENNENSLCLLFESEKCAILVTGDRGTLGEMLLMHETSLPDVDLLVAGHHGSKNSTSEELLKTVQPETVFISVGQNSYGHPAQQTLDRLTRFGCEVFRTDLNGTLIFRR
jgi:competence protein ComEC